MKLIEDNSVDMILCDLPYGVTACEWDKPLPLERLWKQYKRIIKNKGTIILTAYQPFTTDLINSNREWFKYELIWDKVKSSGMFNANRMPMRVHENILVFYNKLGIYNPQKTERAKKDLRSNRIKNSLKKPYQSSDVYVGKNIKFSKNYEEDKVNPKSIITLTSREDNKRFHPTQKPIKLFRYLIKTYTNEGDLVLDNCIGSGTTAIVAKQLGRNFIGFEISEEYCKIANERLKQETLLPITQPNNTLKDYGNLGPLMEKLNLDKWRD